MTLAEKTVYKIVALVFSLVVMGGAALWGLEGLRRHVHSAYEEYQELRWIEQAEVHVVRARGLLSAAMLDPASIASELNAAMAELDAFGKFQGRQVGRGPPHEAREARSGNDARAILADVAGRFENPERTRSAIAQQTVVLERLDLALTALGDSAAEMDRVVSTTQLAAAKRLRYTIIAVGLLSATIIVVTILINISQYRSMVTPLQVLRRGVHRVASGRFGERLDIAGDTEFLELTEDFNRMASQLDNLYRDLESKVVTTSRELVRSERLASVGYLAAGLAHEINNPLNIISGFAELSLGRLRRRADETSVAEAKDTLKIIRDEAFRCKAIIEKLLLLAKPGEFEREPVSMAHVVDEVAAMVRGLQRYRDRKLALTFDDADELTVLANDTELKQVVLNLTVNALEAIEPGSGEVRVRGARRNGWVELQVEDNGRGMAPETVAHVFEPFFTDDATGQRRGVGLGLSITHAIIEGYGGQISAQSAGPGRGSRFIVQMPACKAEHSDDRST